MFFSKKSVKTVPIEKNTVKTEQKVIYTDEDIVKKWAKKMLDRFTNDSYYMDPILKPAITAYINHLNKIIAGEFNFDIRQKEKTGTYPVKNYKEYNAFVLICRYSILGGECYDCISCAHEYTTSDSWETAEHAAMVRAIDKYNKSKNEEFEEKINKILGE